MAEFHASNITGICALKVKLGLELTLCTSAMAIRVVMFPHSTRYNKAHIKTRNSVERAFGVWKRRFPCLDMRLQHKPHRAVQIITACAALHNLACLRKEPHPPPPPAPPVTPRARRTRRRARRPVHLPPVDAVEDSMTGLQARDLLILRSFS